MRTFDPVEIEDLSRQLKLDTSFLLSCLEASVVHIPPDHHPLELDHTTLRRLRQLQRLCDTFEIDPPIAALLVDRTVRIDQLEEEVRRLRRALETHLQ